MHYHVSTIQAGSIHVFPEIQRQRRADLIL
ncbi:hypothetical protein PPN31114_00291 [Pandoraea pneumonica]|uniref:Uncharacterized protein n=1 Tax=Pandoraea pneumonica TaxID=2508299 RepID=A0A5E4RSC3_9BURK|nr:hypothetical protein PPN31114_00291 [Pandoraea pneumonica]